MKFDNLSLFTFTWSFYCCIKIVKVDRIIGCNGFIKSKVPIDFSKVEVRLLSEEGNVKDRIECAPNNGYFFLPIYGKGNYTLQISSIYKWIFDPTEVKVNFDGDNDICSRGTDIIFTFKGFRVFGKVTSIGGRKGPKDVTITLVADLPTEQKEINSVLTGENGFFDISPILPGSYIIKASHKKWRISKSLTTFVIENGNYEIQPKSLLFAGYDVRGTVVSNGEPIAGVNFILFSDTDTTVDVAWLTGCNSSSIDISVLGDIKLPKTKQLCHVTSDQNGQFLFPSVPSGNYITVPFYRELNLKFDVQPKLAHFSVLQDSFIFMKSFQVSGFNIIGRIISHPKDGKPLPGLKVIFDGEKDCETNKDGFFTFEGIKTGHHRIQVRGNDYLFSDVELKLSPNSAIIHDIYPSSFKISGTIKKLQPLNIIVKFTNENGEVIESQADENGHYEVFLKLGNYNASIQHIGNIKSDRILWFSPKSIPVIVLNEALKDINFEQKAAYLIGFVECTDDDLCPHVNIVLRSLDFEDEYHKITENGKFEFTELFPGHYELSVLSSGNWCWEFDSQKIFVSEIHNVASTFKRIGIAFVVSSSHFTQLKYKKLSSNETVLKEGNLNIEPGVNHYCLPGLATYQLEPVGCHRFLESVILWETERGILELTAISHEIIASVISSELVDDLFINIYSKDNNTLKMRIGPLKPNISAQSHYTYKFYFFIENNENLILIPESSSLLFYPRSLDVQGLNDCAELKEQIIAKKGILLSGFVEPPLENVKISILSDDNKVVASTFTDKKGKYKFMPLNSEHNYKLIGEKEGYVLMGPVNDSSFIARKLAEIQIITLDDKEQILPNVLLSLSGGENYRQTSQSNAEGKISFLSLKPSEYYLRPMLKEYKFSPPSKVINIKEGELVQVLFKGYRVLYSIFGSVHSLNRIPERDVVIEAVSKAEDECVQHQEEGISEENGLFRIRGLQPQCVYDVRLKKVISVNQNIYKTLPENLRIKMNATDIPNINLITVPEASECDIFVFIILDNTEYLRTLQLKLFDDDGNIIQALKLNEWKTSHYSLKSVLLSLSNLPLNYKNYYVQLESSLSKSTYDYLPQILHFTANSTFKLLKINFRPELKSSNSEIKHSYAAAICITLLALAYWCKESILVFLSQLQNNSNISLPKFLKKYSQQLPKNKENERTFIEFEPGLTVVKRKIKPRKM